MTSKSTEEWVEEGKKIVCDYLDDVRRLLNGQSSKVAPQTFTKWQTYALTQHTNDRLREVLEKLPPKREVNRENFNRTVSHGAPHSPTDIANDAHNRVLNDITTLLQAEISDDV